MYSETNSAPWEVKIWLNPNSMCKPVTGQSLCKAWESNSKESETNTKQ